LIIKPKAIKELRQFLTDLTKVAPIDSGNSLPAKQRMETRTPACPIDSVIRRKKERARKRVRSWIRFRNLLREIQCKSYTGEESTYILLKWKMEDRKLKLNTV
jgi:hypothetical protein